MIRYLADTNILGYFTRGARAALHQRMGLALQANHIAQKALHPSLVSELAEQIVTTAKRYGARGWKVNGAGGEGGSMCLLAPADPEIRAHMIAAVEAIGHAVVLPLRCAREGVTVVNRP